MIELSKLTLIIPSYNRHRYALRSLRYWSGKGIRVHLLDGSERGIMGDHLEELDDNVSYHHVPLSFYDRLKMGAELVETEYAALLSDDEFFLPSAIQACITELQGEPLLAACTGWTLAFNADKGQVIGFPFYREMQNYAVLHDDPIERIIYHLGNGLCSTIYAIVRAPVLKSAISVVTEKNWPLYGIMELQVEISISLHGKSKVIPHLMWLRSQEQEPIRGNEPSLTPGNGFEKWWLNAGKSLEHEELLSRMAKHLEQDTQIEYQRIYAGVQQVFDELSRRNSNIGNRETTNPLICDFKNKTINTLAALMPTPIKKFFRPYWITSLLKAGKSLAEAGCSVNDRELLEIEGLVAQFHKDREEPISQV